MPFKRVASKRTLNPSNLPQIQPSNPPQSQSSSSSSFHSSMAERKRLRKGSQASSSSLPPPPRAQAPPQIQGAPRPQLPPQGVNPGVRPQLPPQGVPPGVRPPIQGGPSTQQIRGPSQADLAKNHPDNRWIFRNSDAWTKYNGAFGETRTFAKGLYFVLPSDHKISEWEWEFLNTRLEF